MTDSQEWWPADYGHYGPFFIRMAWHAAGTYRTGDGRGGASSGQQRFAPLNSWPDNGNLDKARRLLWPIKQKYGKQISWADLFDPHRQRRDRIHGLPVFGFGGGREGRLGARKGHLLGPEETEWVGDRRRRASDDDGKELENPLAAIQMGLIYVNPEGPTASPTPKPGARHARDLRPHGDERRGNRRADRRRPHLRQGATAPAPRTRSAPEPEGAAWTSMGFGWMNDPAEARQGTRSPAGIEGAWTKEPDRSGTTATSTCCSTTNGS